MTPTAFAHESTLISLFPTATKNTAAAHKGSGVDVSAYEGDVAVVLDSDNGGGSDDTLDVKVQHSATDVDGNYVDVTGAAFTQVTNSAASQQKIVLRAEELKKYIRVVGTVAGTTHTFKFSVNALGRKKYIS